MSVLFGELVTDRSNAKMRIISEPQLSEKGYFSVICMDTNGNLYTMSVDQLRLVESLSLGEVK